MVEAMKQGTHRILIGDCRETLLTVESGSVQCIVTSPPYWGLRSYHGNHGMIGLEPTFGEHMANLMQVFAECWRVLRDDGTLWVNYGDAYAANRGGTAMPAETLAGGVSGHGDKVAKRGRESDYCPSRDPASHGLKHKDMLGMPWRIAFALQDAGWTLRQDIIWHKPNPMPESVTDRCTKSHEYLFLLTKRPRYFYNAEAIKEPSGSVADYKTPDGWDTAPGSHGTIHRKGREKGTKKMPPIGRIKHAANGENATASGNRPEFYPTRNRRSVWTIPTAPFSDAHFATFPPALVEPCILAGSKPGDTVLDPFGGSGTVAAVACPLGRNAIICEISPEYAAMAEDRIGKACRPNTYASPKVIDSPLFAGLANP